jgi:hypothetical protein
MPRPLRAELFDPNKSLIRATHLIDWLCGFGRLIHYRRDPNAQTTTCRAV